MAFPERFIEELKFKNDISDIVSSYVSLKKRGRNLVGLCPFHSEKTASFNVYPENGSFYCFGCGVGGDVITFIEKIENLDYVEAIKFLAQKANMSLPESDGKEEQLSKLRRRLFEVNRESALFFHNQLYKKDGEKALNYLLKRGLSPQIIKHFGLGYSPENKHILIDYLKEKGFKDFELTQANLAFSSNYSKPYSRFFNRVMFPIIDLRGNVIAFGGRALSDVKPKYLNTSDTPVFKKSSNLFALNVAKNFCQNNIILVEGYMDVIALHKAGFQNTVATLGTALTSEQAQIISRYTKEVIICYDSDEAGQKASARAIDILRKTNLLIRVLNIPKGKDPDEFIRSYGDEGHARFKRLVENACNDVEYQLLKASRENDIATTDGKIAYLKSAIKILSKVNSSIEREIYAIKLSEMAGVDKSTILSQVAKEARQSSKSKNKQQFREIEQKLSAQRDQINKEKHDNLRSANAEEAIIAFLINHPEYINTISESLSPEKFSTQFNKRVYEFILDQNLNQKNLSISSFRETFDKDEFYKITGFLALESHRESNINSANEYIKVILEEHEKLKDEKLKLASNKDILEYIGKLREQKK